MKHSPWRPGKVRPIPGNAPHDRPVSRGMNSIKERLRRSLKRPGCHLHTATPRYAFSRHDGIYRSDVVQNQKPNPGAGAVPPPVGRPRARVEGRAGRITPCSSSAMSSGRLFLDQVARQQSLSPLHRHGQIIMAFSGWAQRVTFLLCRTGGHFYFAATKARQILDSTGRTYIKSLQSGSNSLQQFQLSRY